MTRLYTIGHSTRSIEQFLATLQSFHVETLVDIRRYPASRRNPQYGTEELKKSLFHAKIEYVFLGDELGGMRKATAPSRHPSLAESAFQGYADWMERPMFAEGVARLLEVANRTPTAYMCAERTPPACHRHLLSDYLTLVHQIDVVDLLDPGLAQPHRVSPTVRRDGSGIRYDVVPGVRRLDEPFEP